MIINLNEELVGETKFTALARAYIAQHPLDIPNARWYSRRLPDFLRNSQLFERKPELAEMAELERALDAPETPVVTLADLATLDPSVLGTLSVATSPSLRRFKVRSNVTSLWASLRCGELPPYPITLDAAITGNSFATIHELIAAVADPATAEARAAGFLRGWIEAEIISELRSAASPGENSQGQLA